MKRIFCFLVLITFILKPSFSYALGIGANIRPLGNFKTSVAVLDNLVIQNDYKGDGVDIAYIDKRNDIYLKAAVGLSDYFNLYALLGGMTAAQLTRDWGSVNKTEYKMEPTIVWGFGVNAVFDIEDYFFIGSDTHFTSCKPDIQDITHNGSMAINTTGGYEFSDFQETLYVGKRFETVSRFNYKGSSAGSAFVPYVGVLYNYSKLDSIGDVKWTVGPTSYVASVDQQKLNNEDVFGIALGADIEFSDFFVLNIEGRFVSGTSFTLGGSFRF